MKFFLLITFSFVCSSGFSQKGVRNFEGKKWNPRWTTGKRPHEAFHPKFSLFGTYGIKRSYYRSPHHDCLTDADAIILGAEYSRVSAEVKLRTFERISKRPESEETFDCGGLPVFYVSEFFAMMKELARRSGLTIRFEYDFEKLSKNVLLDDTVDGFNQEEMIVIRYYEVDYFGPVQYINWDHLPHEPITP